MLADLRRNSGSNEQCRYSYGLNFLFVQIISKRHLEGRKRVPRFQGPIRARSWREWADQRASSPERPCVLPAKQKVPRPPSPHYYGRPADVLRTDTARITNRYPTGMRHPEPSTPCSHPDHALHAKAKDLLCYSSGYRLSKQSWIPYSAAGPILRLRGNHVRTLCCSHGSPQDGASRGVRWMLTGNA